MSTCRERELARARARCGAQWHISISRYLYMFIYTHTRARLHMTRHQSPRCCHLQTDAPRAQRGSHHAHELPARHTTTTMRAALPRAAAATWDARQGTTTSPRMNSRSAQCAAQRARLAQVLDGVVCVVVGGRGEGVVGEGESLL